MGYSRARREPLEFEQETPAARLLGRKVYLLAAVAAIFAAGSLIAGITPSCVSIVTSSETPQLR